MVLSYWANVDQVVNSAAEDFAASFICGCGLILTKPIIRHNTNIPKYYSGVYICLIILKSIYPRIWIWIWIWILDPICNQV